MWGAEPGSLTIRIVGSIFDAPAPSRPLDSRGRILPAPGGGALAHARGRPDDPRRPGAVDRRVPGTDPLAAAPGAALPAQAGAHGDRQRPPGVGGRSELQPGVPRAPHGAAGAGRLGAVAKPDGADLLPAPGSLQAAV